MSAAMTLARPLRFPSLTRAEAAVARVRYANRAALPLPGGRLRLELRGAEAPGCNPAPVRVALSWGEEKMELFAPAGLLREVLSSLEPGLEVEALPPDLAGLLAEAALAPVVETWERVSGLPVSVLRVDRDGSGEPGAGLPLRLAGDGPGGAGRVWALHLACGPAAVAALLAAWPTAPRAMDWLGLPGALRLGVTRLPHRVLASLRPDDAVLLETWMSGSAMLVVAEAWTAPARSGAGGWHMTEAPGPARRQGWGTWTMDGDDASLTPAVADPDAIPVTLTFEVGRMEIPLGELRRMGPGSILEVGRGAGELVEIAAHGRAIGRGELVDVEGAVAVRIVRLFDHG